MTLKFNRKNWREQNRRRRQKKFAGSDGFDMTTYLTQGKKLLLNVCKWLDGWKMSQQVV